MGIWHLSVLAVIREFFVAACVASQRLQSSPAWLRRRLADGVITLLQCLDFTRLWLPP